MTDLCLRPAIPLTHPVTRLTTSVDRDNVARVEPGREATICGAPQIFRRPLSRRCW